MKNPKIRFKGCTEDWEQRKLEDYLEVSREKNKDEEYGKEDVLSVSGEYGIVNQIEFQGRSFAGASVANYGVVDVGDVVYTKSPLKSNPYGIIKANKGKQGIVSTLYAVYKPRLLTDSEFVQIYFELDSRMNSYMHPLVNKGAKNDMKVSDENALKGPVVFPKLEEQRAISQYFRSLDSLITLHQCKYQNYPMKYVNDWEQRKFEEFVRNVAKKNKDNLDLEPYAVTNDRGFIAQKDAHDEFGYMSNVDRTAYNIVPPKSFAYNPARINVGSLGYYEGSENVIVSSLYEVFQTEDYIDDRFLWHWLKSEHFPKWIEKLQEGSVRLYFYFDKLIQCQLMIPSYEEQHRISAYLDSIDTLITLHQRKNVIEAKNTPYVWEQRKVGEYLVESRELGHKGDAARKMTVKLWGKGVYEKNETGSSNTQYFVRHANQFIYSKLDFLNCAFGVVPEELESLETTADVPAFDCYGIEPYFMFYTAIQPQFYVKNGTIADGSRKAKRIHADVFLDMPFDVPCLEEQRAIIGALKQVDNLITLHQRKCDELQKIKKYMLQNMFV